MRYIPVLIYRRITVIVFLCFVAGCRPKDFTSVFQNQKFDQQVIEKLPLYDSLSNVLLHYYPSIQQYIKEKNSYKYIIYFDSTDTYKEFPKEGSERIKKLVTQLSKRFIYGFEVFKDSTIKIYIRDSYLKPYRLNVIERLSYYPAGSDIKHREFPAKDTILNKNWQYWILFEQENLF